MVLNVGRNNTGGNHSGELITATEGYQRGVIGSHIVSSRNGKLDIGNCIVARGRGGLDQLVVAIIQATPGKSGHVLTLKLGPYSFICTRSVLLIQGEACALQRDEFRVAVAVGASFSSILGRIIGGVLGNLVDDGLVGEYDDTIIGGLAVFAGLFIIGIVGIAHMGGVLVAGGANNGLIVQRGGILNRNDTSGLDRGNVLQVGKADLKGAAVGQAFGHNLIASGNQRSVNIDFHRILIEDQASVFLIVESQLVAVGVVGVVLRNGGAQLEGYGIADIVVSGILPISGGVRRAVIGVLNLLIGGCGSNLGRDSRGADNLDYIQGVGFTVIDRAVVLDQIVAGGYGQRITIGNRTEFFRIQFHIFLNLR